MRYSSTSLVKPELYLGIIFIMVIGLVQRFIFVEGLEQLHTFRRTCESGALVKEIEISERTT